MTNNEAKELIAMIEVKEPNELIVNSWWGSFAKDYKEALQMAIEALKQKPRKGEWRRMSDLSEQEDDRYKCSHCGNVVHYRNKMNLYTFNRWCGRCGSDNGRKIDEAKQELAYADQEAMMPATNLIQGKRAGIFEFAF